MGQMMVASGSGKQEVRSVGGANRTMSGSRLFFMEQHRAPLTHHPAHGLFIVDDELQFRALTFAAQDVQLDCSILDRGEFIDANLGRLRWERDLESPSREFQARTAGPAGSRRRHTWIEIFDSATEPLPLQRPLSGVPTRRDQSKQPTR